MSKKCEKYICEACKKEHIDELQADNCCNLLKLARKLFDDKVNYPNYDNATIDITPDNKPRLKYTYYLYHHSVHRSNRIWIYIGDSWIGDSD